MFQEALKYLYELRPLCDLKVIDGLNYQADGRTLSLLLPPLADGVSLTTLSGLLELLEFGIEEQTEEQLAVDYFLKVADHTKVGLVVKNVDKYGRRPWLVTVNAMTSEQFKFGSYLTPDEFMIGLLSKFVQSDERDKLITLASSLTSESSTEANDDGITQNLVVKSGAALKRSIESKPRVTLAPYRTFSEAVQPESDFIFRVKKVADNQPPNCALFEADGGAWKAQAMLNIKAKLEFNTRVKVIA